MKIQKYLLLATSLLTLIAAAGYFYLTKGILWNIKDPSDKTEQQPAKTNNEKTSLSPFGIAPRSLEIDANYAEDLGFTSVRLAAIEGLPWDLVQNDGYSRTDKIFKAASDKGLEISVVVLSDTNPVATNTLSQYKKFLQDSVERYDGDGIDDAPGSPVVTYWEIDNEPDLYEGEQERTPWKGEISETKDYALVLKTAYQAIKIANPNAKVAIAGMAGKLEYYEAIFQELEKIKDKEGDKYFDAFNYHYYGAYNQYGQVGFEINSEQFSTVSIPSLIKIQNSLKQYNYSEIELIMTETGTHLGSAVISGHKTQTETEHAEGVFKRYIYAIAHGVDRIYWVGVQKDGSDYFSSMGLVNNGQKSVAYYAYKHMTEELKNSDWAKVEIIQEKDNVYVYKFTKKDTGKPVYVAWWDYWNEEDKTEKEAIVNIDFDKALITNAIPNAQSGKDLDENNYPNFFQSQSGNIQNRQLTLKLNQSPVFIEKTN